MNPFHIEMLRWADVPNKKCFLVLTKCNDTYGIMMPERNKDVNLTEKQRINISQSGNEFVAQLFESNCGRTCYAAMNPEDALAGLKKMIESAAYEYWFVRYEKYYIVVRLENGLHAHDVGCRYFGAIQIVKLLPQNGLVKIFLDPGSIKA